MLKHNLCVGVDRIDLIKGRYQLRAAVNMGMNLPVP
jgi:hypothetical protein